MKLTLTQKLHAQRIRQNLLNGYPPRSGFAAVMARIMDPELLVLEREAHKEKLAWLVSRRTKMESPFDRIVRKAVTK
jgi:hypothetical protein